MNKFNVYFENTFWGYAWAKHEFEAIVKVSGDVCIDDLGQRDFRWVAIEALQLADAAEAAAIAKLNGGAA